jgi:tetratricopeptide (TPR) repeat protein
LALALSRAALNDSETAAEGADFGEARRMRAAQHLDALTGLGAVEAMAAGRLRLHPLLRQQIAPRLSALDDDHTRQALGEAMARWWLEYARQHHGYEGMAGLESEAAGLMGALTWAHAHGQWRLTLDLAEALGAVWRAHGRRDEALRIAQWAAEAADAEGDDLHERHWARYQLAVAQSEAGMLTQARTGFAEALGLARELNDPVLVRDGAHALAALAARTGEAELARASFSEALTLARELDDPASVRDELHGLAILDAQANRLPEARAAYTEALSLARALGDDWATYLERYGLALVEMRAGETEQAREGFAEALALAERMDDRGARCDVLSSLGALDAQRGELATARDGLLEAVAIAQEVRDPRRGARALVWLAEVESVSGDMILANEHFEQARALYEALGDSEAIGAMRRMRAFDGAS